MSEPAPKSIYLEELAQCIAYLDNCDPIVEVEEIKHAVSDALKNIESELAWHRRMFADDRGMLPHDDGYSGDVAEDADALERDGGA